MVCYLILFRVFLVRNMEFHCMFQSILDCSDTQELVEAQLTLTHQDKVKQCSKRRNDNFYETLDPNIALYYHQNLYFRYTYNHIERYLKRKNQNQKVSLWNVPNDLQLHSLVLRKTLICREACNKILVQKCWLWKGKAIL